MCFVAEPPLSQFRTKDFSVSYIMILGELDSFSYFNFIFLLPILNDVHFITEDLGEVRWQTPSCSAYYVAPHVVQMHFVINTKNVLVRGGTVVQ